MNTFRREQRLIVSAPKRTFASRFLARLAVSLAGICLVLTAAPAWAHHSFSAEYDARKPITLRGVVTKIEWTNPHAHFHIDAKDDTGAIANWNVELASPRVLVQYGWRLNSLHVGDEVTMEGSLAKDGSKRVNARTVTLADGHLVSAGSSGGDVPQQ
jgi:hypothetical protein